MYDLSYMYDLRSHIITHQGRDAQVSAALEHLKWFEPYTAEHSQRVGLIAGAIAAELGFNEEEIILTTASGRLHDIGKSGISLDYLCKPSALSDEEYREVQRHPELGARLIQACPTLLELIPGILYHHERYDGLGYPFNLRGEEIPLIARVIAVADTYDAMTSHRVYRPALSHQHAIHELLLHSDTQFDQQVVEAALNAGLECIDPPVQFRSFASTGS